ncbi:hypothetical protein J2X36_004627 [Methylobacterium sp. BE186]|uniref:hypothetical protein n=1 Tax=Methylobacterium sp. BE186 TaxID=2817715 RepID=UPI00285E029C|nr:hypothetical protein [Methylobacterium sp. BE186]MDR7039849.1 hypothetical protein [Methylobacterium sp. BE186]
MDNQTALDALALQHQRLTDMLRSADSGIWWSSDAAAGLNAEKIKAQADMIGAALDELESLIKKINA